ncbi:hypothetical protein BSKO_11134 [Bryopsis sp. KO-2023]|nr:hypothetical protein BSKO_11134 [Bryopsis sp. KO-2023]
MTSQLLCWRRGAVLFCLLSCWDQAWGTKTIDVQPQDQECSSKVISVSLWSLKDITSNIEQFPTAVLEKPPDATGALDEFFVQALPGVDDYWPFLGNSTGPSFDSYFAAKFETRICLPTTGALKFVVHSDDGSILFLDDDAIVSMDQPQSIASKPSEVLNVSAGCHDLRLHMFQNDGASLAKVEMGDVNEAGDVSNNAVLTAARLSPPGCTETDPSANDDQVDECATPASSAPCNDEASSWFFNLKSGMCELGSCESEDGNHFPTREECREKCVGIVNQDWASNFEGLFECHMPNTDAIVNHTCHCKPGFSGGGCELQSSPSTGNTWGTSVAIAAATFYIALSTGFLL